METRCKVGDEYYALRFIKNLSKLGNEYAGTLFLDSPLEFEYIDEGGSIKIFNPIETNQDIINAIKDSIDEFELNQASITNM